MNYPIHHTFGPHVDGMFLLQALSLLLRPWQWKRGNQTEELRKEFERRFGALCALFATGREGLLALLRAMDTKPGDEIIVQGYTCVVVPNAIAAAGAKPVFVDIDPQTLNLTIETVTAAITPKTRAIICQHTFGILGPLEDLRALCDEKKILLIEDCAHILPDREGPPLVAKTGDAVLFSFGRDKAISGVSGGAMLCRDEKIAKRLLEEEKKANDLGLLTIKRLLLYPVIYSLCRPLYGIWIGKIILFAARKIRLLPSIVSEEEKHGTMPQDLRKLPNACAALALQSLRKIDTINNHRRMLVRLYLQACADFGWPVLRAIGSNDPLLKFPFFFQNARQIRKNLKKKNIHLDDGWTGCVICPGSVDAKDAGYEKGCDPQAEATGESIVSLPTHPTMTGRQAELLIEELRRHL